MQCSNAVCTLVNQLQKKLLFISVMKQKLLVSLQMEVICFRKYFADETRNWIGFFILSCHTFTFPSSFVNSIAQGTLLRHTGDAYVVSQWCFPSNIHVYLNTCKQNCSLSHCKSCCGAATNFLLSPNSKLHPSVAPVLLSLADDIQGERFQKLSNNESGWSAVTKMINTIYFLEERDLHLFSFRE